MRSKMTILVSIYGLFQIAAWVLWWTQNKLVAKGFCCGYTHSIQRILFEQTGETGIFSWMITLLFLGIPHAKTPLIFVGMIYLLTGLYLWKKTEGNHLPVLLYFSMPAPFVAAHRLDFYVFGQLTLFFFWFLFQNREHSFPKVLGLGCIFLVPYLSARSTDNILLLGAICSFAFLKRPLLVILCVGVLFSALQVADGSGLSYYQSEYSLLSSFDVFQITTYGSYLFWRGVGFLPFALVVMFAVRYYAKIPKDIWFWIVGCYVVLTMTTKKNHYYIFVLWPVFPLIVHYATENMKNTHIYRMSSVVLLVWSVLLQLSLFPQNPFHNSISLIQGNSRWGGVFQTADGNLDATVRSRNWADVVISRIQIHPPTGNLWCTTSIPIDEISLRLWTTNKIPIKNLTKKNKDQIKKGDAVIVPFQDRMRFSNLEQMATFYDHRGRMYVYVLYK